MLANGGVRSLWSGFAPYFLRLGQHTVYTFLILEQLRALFCPPGVL